MCIYYTNELPITMDQGNIKKEHGQQNIKVAIDCCIFTIINGELCVLLIKMKLKLANFWALPGGLINNNETADEAVRRILKQQTSVNNVYLEQLYTFSKIDRDPFNRVVSIAYFALIPAENVVLKTSPKYADVRWWKTKELPDLAYDHKKIAKYSQKRLQWKVTYTNVIWSLLPGEFSLSQLQNVYESVLGKMLDKRNFRKKILGLYIIKETGNREINGAHRPAKLYKFTSKEPKNVEII